MRTKNSAINVTVSCSSWFIIMISSFIARKLFVNVLGLSCVGIEGTFSTVVSAFAIVELGLGVGIVYKLYKPVANQDWNQISVILSFLKKCYIAIASVVTALGISMAYFVIKPIKGDFSQIWLMQIFMLYIANVVASYLFSHKRAMFIADQKNYVNNLIHVASQIMMVVLQIAVLKLFASFEAYLICRIVFQVAENCIISYRFNKKYPLVNLKTADAMSGIEKKDLFRNIKAMLFHKIAGVGSTTASSLIMFYSVSLDKNGIYHNYMLIVMAITNITNEIFNGIMASFGNLLTTNDRKKIYSNFNTLYFMNFLLYSFITTAFICVSTPFMNLWTCSFDLWTTVAMAAYLYIYGIRQSIGMAKVGAGIYDPDKYMAVLGAVITFASSFFLVKPMGISGIMVGNLIGILVISQWIQPYLVYDVVFKKSSKSYHIKFVIYTSLTAFYSWSSYCLCSYVNAHTKIFSGVDNLVKTFGVPLASSQNITQIIINVVICTLVPNILNILIFFKTQEFQNLLMVSKTFLKRGKN